jgi:hypothetical protein
MKVYKIGLDMLDVLSGMDAISLVYDPAMEVNFLTFSKEYALQFANDEKRIVSGIVCLADTPILRVNPETGEQYQVVFTKDVIEKLMEKYSKQLLINRVNIEHTDDSFTDGIYMLESFIINKERGICPVEFENVPDGSWYISFKVENELLWDKIKSGEVRGFSLQGLFNLTEMVEEEMSREKKQPEWARSKPWDKDKKKTVTDIQHNDKEIVNSLIESLADGNISIDEFSDKIYNVL